MVVFRSANGSSRILWYNSLPGGRQLLAIGELHGNSGNGHDVQEYINAVSKRGCVDVYLEKVHRWTNSIGRGMLRDINTRVKYTQTGIRWHDIDARLSLSRDGKFNLPSHYFDTLGFNNREYFAFLTSENQVLLKSDRRPPELNRIFKAHPGNLTYKDIAALRRRFKKQRSRFLQTHPRRSDSRLREHIRLWSNKHAHHSRVMDLFTFYRMFGDFHTRRIHPGCPSTQRRIIFIAGQHHVFGLQQLIKRIFNVNPDKEYGYNMDMIDRIMQTEFALRSSRDTTQRLISHKLRLDLGVGERFFGNANDIVGDKSKSTDYISSDNEEDFDSSGSSYWGGDSDKEDP